MTTRLGSTLFSALGSPFLASVYSKLPGESVGSAYKQLLSQGFQFFIGHLVAGGAFHFGDDIWPYSKLTIHVGQVAANAHIDSAVNPAWRSAKIHVSILPDTVSSLDVKF